MTLKQPADANGAQPLSVAPDSPIGVAYDRGFHDGLAVAVKEVAKLRREIAELRQEQRLAA